MTFQDLINAGLRQDAPMRLLFLFVKIEEMQPAGPDERGTGTLAPVMVTDKLISPDLTFKDLLSEADNITSAWDFMLISTFSRSDGNIPTSEEVEPQLQRMANTVVSGGDLGQFAVFDRQENALRIETNARSGTA